MEGRVCLNFWNAFFVLILYNCLTAGTSFLFFLFIVLFSEKEDKLYHYYNALYKWSFVLKIFLHIKTYFPLLLFRNMFIPVCVCMYVHACVCVCGWGVGVRACVWCSLIKIQTPTVNPFAELARKVAVWTNPVVWCTTSTHVCVVYFKYMISRHCVCVVYYEYIISIKHWLATRRLRAGWVADACPSHVARRARAGWNRSISNARLEKRTSDVREGGSPSHAFMKNKVNNFHFS